MTTDNWEVMKKGPRDKDKGNQMKKGPRDVRDDMSLGPQVCFFFFSFHFHFINKLFRY
jgi:hypothetical protein